MMLKNPLLLSLLAMLPVALCPAQEEPADAEQAPAARSLSDLSIPELLVVAHQLRTTGRYNDAVNVLNRVLQKDPANIDALRMMGDIAWETRNAEGARTYWRRVVSIQSNDFEANFGLGRVYLASNQYRQAMHYLEIAERVAPPDQAGELLIGLARAYRGSGMREEAIQTLAKMLGLDYESYEAWYLLVALWIERATTDEDFDRALAGAQRLREIADTEFQAGSTPERVKNLQSAYEINLQVLYAFRQILFERNADGTLSDRLLPGREKLAGNVIAEIVDVMVQQTELRRTLSYYQILELAKQAVEYDGGTNPSTLLRLASLQRGTQKLAQARETFRRILELDPHNELARRQLDVLESQLPAPPATQPLSPAP